jgi:hypothetical protein
LKYDKEEKQGKHLRIIYTRVLERGLSKCVSYLIKDKNDSKERFLDFVETIRKPIEKAEVVDLDNEYYNGLKKLMESILTLRDREFDYEETARDIVRTANGLQKIQRQRNTRRDKHKKKKFEDDY